MTSNRSLLVLFSINSKFVHIVIVRCCVNTGWWEKGGGKEGV